MSKYSKVELSVSFLDHEVQETSPFNKEIDPSTYLKGWWPTRQVAITWTRQSVVGSTLGPLIEGFYISNSIQQ